MENNRGRVDRKRLTEVEAIMRWIIADALGVLTRLFDNFVWMGIFDRKLMTEQRQAVEVLFGSLRKTIRRKNYEILRRFFNYFLDIAKIAEKVVRFIQTESAIVQEAKDVR